MTNKSAVFETPLYWHFIAYGNHKRCISAEARLKKISKLTKYYSRYIDDSTNDKTFEHFLRDIEAELKGTA